MILIAVGANLPSRFGSPQAACEAAYRTLNDRGVRVVAQSGWFETAPVPVSDQPWYVNGIAVVDCDLGPTALLSLLHEVEAEMGRVRTVQNAPRVIDLDLLSHGEIVMDGNICIPHPRLAERAFVLLPLREVAPGWRHPVTGKTVDDMIAGLPSQQVARRLGTADRSD